MNIWSRFKLDHCSINGLRTTFYPVYEINYATLYIYIFQRTINMKTGYLEFLYYILKFPENPNIVLISTFSCDKFNHIFKEPYNEK